jgi:hypothetical protein
MVFCVDFIIGEICVAHCVPYNLFTFNMKQNYCTVEFKKKKKCQVLLCSGVTGLMKLILGGERSKRSSVHGTVDDSL